jgi:hypothetical protein
MEPITDHADLIDKLGGNTAVAEQIEGCTAGRVGQWKIGNRIPPEYWPEIIRIADAKGRREITSDWLMTNLRPRQMPGEKANEAAAA